MIYPKNSIIVIKINYLLQVKFQNLIKKYLPFQIKQSLEVQNPQ